MSALRILAATAEHVATTAEHTVAAAQQLILLALPHGGQAAARSNAQRAMESADARAADRRRANAAFVAAAVRHPVVAPRARHREPVALVAAHG